MGTKPALWATACVFIGLAIPPVTSAELIYDNTTTSFTGSRTFTTLQLGNQVTAGGTGRIATLLEIGLSSQGVPATASTLQAFLYANDGGGGAPGTLLWQSAVRQNVALTGGNDLIAFAVPNVTVPTTFTWAVQVGSATPVAAGLPSFGSPTVGTFVNGWFGGPGSWTTLATSPFLARITVQTVPEPATLITTLGGIALVGLAARRRSPAR